MRTWILNALTGLAALASGAVVGGAAIAAAAVTGVKAGVYRNSDLSTRTILLAPMIVAAIAVMTLLPRRIAGAAATAGGATIWVLAATAEGSGLTSGTVTFVLWVVALGALAGGSITSLTGTWDLPGWLPMALFGLGFTIVPHLRLPLVYSGEIAVVTVALAAATVMSWTGPSDASSPRAGVPWGPAATLVAAAGFSAAATAMESGALRDMARNHGGMTPGVRIAAALVAVLITALIVAIGLVYAIAAGKLVLARALVVAGAFAAPAFASTISLFTSGTTTTMAVLVAVASAAVAALAIRLRRVPWEALPLAVAGFAFLVITPITANGRPVTSLDAYVLYVGVGAAFVAFNAVIAAIGAHTADEARPTRPADLAVVIGVLVLAVSQIGGFVFELLGDEATITRTTAATMLIAAALTAATAGFAERKRRTPPAVATSPDLAGTPGPGAGAAAGD